MWLHIIHIYKIYIFMSSFNDLFSYYSLCRLVYMEGDLNIKRFNILIFLFAISIYLILSPRILGILLG